jgi:hypothetical protein
MRESSLNGSLLLQCDDCQSENDAEQDEQEYLHNKAQVKGKETQWENIVQNDAVEDGKDAEAEELVGVSVLNLQYLSVGGLVFASLCIQSIIETL